MDKGFWGGLFDVNRDGELELFEIVIDWMLFDEIVNDS